MPSKRILLLALGNDIMSDDAAGWLVARALEAEFCDEIDLLECGEAGLALMELMTGYQRVLLVDSIKTEKHPPGTVVELDPGGFQAIIAPSPHYAGIPEVFDVAARYGFPMPDELRILALEVLNPWEVGESLSPEVERALPSFIEASRSIIQAWLDEPAAVKAEAPCTSCR